MKKLAVVVSAILAVALAGNGEEVRFRETGSIVWLSEKEVYGRFEYQISQNTSVNAILVFPSEAGVSFVSEDSCVPVLSCAISCVPADSGVSSEAASCVSSLSSVKNTHGMMQ